MKADEKELLERLQIRTSEDPNLPYVRQLVNDLGMNEKRAAYIFGKWSDNGYYEYGVSVMAGWLTDAGRSLQAVKEKVGKL
jgi:hypothetical protein